MGQASRWKNFANARSFHKKAFNLILLTFNNVAFLKKKKISFSQNLVFFSRFAFYSLKLRH